jgi:two-component system CheB/CheR fusion protein
VNWLGTPEGGTPARGPGQAAFPIAGVGASAGGLAATTELLRHIGPRPGAGIVIVQHPDPAHESRLLDVLTRVTTLPVEAAHDGHRVVPNRVYVVPPNARSAIAGGVLRLSAWSEDTDPALPIDRFFESLADDLQQRAMGVILSGSGSDGSAGVVAINAAGGVTFAQDASAAFRSMPDSAVATGCVDHQLSPRGIAEELLRRSAEANGVAPTEREEAEFQRLLRLLSKLSGIDFAKYKRATLRRRIQRRVFRHGLHTLGEYLELLDRNPAEAATLCDEVLIHVTRFFRDPASFAALEAHVYPDLLARRRAGAPIRIWVPGCSTGEEVYSLAISLIDFLARADAVDIPIRLFGTDVSASAIARARSGRYAEGIQTDVSPERLERFFAGLDNGYQIRREVREMCVFSRHDATRDPPFSAMDLISCRNLMIYLGAALHARTLSVFHYALKEPGFLLLGSSESIHASPGFASLDGEHNLYRRTPAGPRRTFDFSVPEPADGPALTDPGASRMRGAQEIVREADRLVLAKFAPPGVVINDDLVVVQFRGKTGPYLSPAPGTPSFDLMRMAREELRLALRQTIELARSTHDVAITPGVRLDGEDPARVIDLEVIPMATSGAGQRSFVVLFRDREAGTAGAAPLEPAASPSPLAHQAPLLDRARRELASTRDSLESVNDRLEASNGDLRAANEQVTSSNEELRSTNEELQAAQQEIRESNQELFAINQELIARNAEAKRLNEDLTNVLSSVEIPIVLIGRDESVRRYAPAAARVLGLTPESIGRPIVGVRSVLAVASAELAAEVLAQGSPRERTLQDETGHWYQLTARPYLTHENRIDGTVLVAFDIDPIQKATERLSQAQRERAEKARARSEREFREVLGTTAAGILMTDAAGSIVFVNPSATQLFGYTAAELLGRPVSLLMPERPSQRHAEQRTADPVDREPRGVARERDVVGVRKDGTEVSLQVTLTPLTRETGLLVVCSVTDLSARRESERRIVDYQEKLRQVSFDAALSEERERRRIAADLHDRIGQSLALSQMKLASMPRTGSERTAVDETIELLAQSIVDTRTLIFDLSPPILYELGLKEALSWLAEDLDKRWGMHIEVVADERTLEQTAKLLGDASAALVFRSVKELLTNVLKHARVRAAKVSLRRRDEGLEIDVEDRGAGFDSDARSDGGTAHGRFGLFSVREQMSRLGGTVEIDSDRQRGTRVSLRLPLKPE